MENLKKTPIYDRHIEAGAKMSPFGGFDMPIEYSDIVSEHEAVRKQVGVFDVSHMGEVLVAGPEAVRFVNYIFTNDVSNLTIGKILYGMMLNPDGGTVDDLLVYRMEEQKFLLVINASNIDKDVAWIMTHAQAFNVRAINCSDDWAEIAVQGPASETMLMSVLGIDVTDLSFYEFKQLADGTIVSRTGYTGEDGFEVYSTPRRIDSMWQKLMDAGVMPCGLGCRDTLRFEAGLPLYGDELTDSISPIEAGLGMFVKTEKPEFIGQEAVIRQKTDGVSRKIVGLEIEGPAIARHGYDVLDCDGNKVGEVTTGYRSITLGRNLAMAIVEADCAKLGTKLQVQVRRKIFPAQVIKKRFYTPNYKK